MSSLNTLQFSKEDIDTLWRVVAAVLHLGNVEFAMEEDKIKLKNGRVAGTIAELLKVTPDELQNALCERVIAAHGDIMRKEHTQLEATYGRDALAKAIYDRLFTWIVDKINAAITVDNQNIGNHYRSSLIGVLDIYGFEIFDNNSFEQFCINYCNEKLQQLFIGEYNSAQIHDTTLWKLVATTELKRCILQCNDMAQNLYKLLRLK